MCVYQPILILESITSLISVLVPKIRYHPGSSLRSVLIIIVHSRPPLLLTCLWRETGAYLNDFDPKALAVAVFFPCCPDAYPFLWFNVVLA